MQSLIAAFNNTRTAQQAVERLVQQGFSRSSVHLQSAYDDTAAAASTKPNLADPFGFSGFFSALFGTDSTSEAGKYAEAVRRGNTVVVVDARTDGEAAKATQLLQELGAIDVDQQAAGWKKLGWNGFDARAKPLSREELAAERETVVPVVQEELQVGKRAVEGGGVRVIKRLTETPVSELVTLREEHATVERRPVDRAATEADFTNFKEGTVEIREMSEEAVVGKTSRVVEEVVVGKQVSERTETVSDTVRRTDVEVERVEGKARAAVTAETATASATRK